MNLYQLRNKNWGNAPSRLQLFSAVKTCNKIRPEKSLFKLVQCNWSDYNMIWCDWFVTSRMLFFNSKIKIKQNKSKCIIKILFTNSKAFFYQLYNDWQNQQVLTTISTTGFIEKNCLSFPRYWLKWAFFFVFFDIFDFLNNTWYNLFELIISPKQLTLSWMWIFLQLHFAVLALMKS